MKKLVQRIANQLGFAISRLPAHDGSNSPYSKLAQPNRAVDLETLAAMARRIPGMISIESGKFLYAMCALQEASGAVVEIGSWQGRSTSFLARAVKESGNGPFYAIDHFQGNRGKESHYAVGRADLSDLRGGFLDNMRSLELEADIELLDVTNVEAAARIKEPVRFLFIDGDHTREGVERDIELFFPKLGPSAIVVFDDYEAGFAGLVDAVNKLLARSKTRQVFTYRGTLVMQLR